MGPIALALNIVLAQRMASQTDLAPSRARRAAESTTLSALTLVTDQSSDV